MTFTGETGGAIPLTNTGPHALPVLRAMEEAARTTSATKVHVEEKKRKAEFENLRKNVLPITHFCDFTKR